MNYGLVVMAAVAVIGVGARASAATVTVAVKGVRSDVGEVGCALFSTAEGFPLHTGNAVLRWYPATRSGVACRFDGLRAGTYAIAAAHDVNGNRRTDTDPLGRPTEDWGVSGGARPFLRAPRFGEAEFTLTDDGQRQVDVVLGR